MQQARPGEFLRDAHEILEQRDTVIWRYMSLAKFVSMLDTKSLHFTRIDQLDDRHEAAISRPAFERGVQEALQRKREEENPWVSEEEAIERALLVEAETMRRIRGSVLVNCWHKNPIESGAMWAIYGRDGIAVRSTVGGLFQSTRGHRPTVMIQHINYIDHDVQDMDFSEAFLFKHRLFSFEQELRALMLFSPKLAVPRGWSVPCRLGHLIDAVHLAPRAGGLLQAVVKSLLEKYGLPDVQVVPSEADTVPDYRSRLEEVMAKL